MKLVYWRHNRGGFHAVGPSHRGFGNGRRSANRRSTMLNSNFGGILILIPIVGLALLLMFWTNSIHQDTRTGHQYEIPAPARCTLTATGISWAGHPVYRLTNQTHATLHHVTLMSWSEQDVPILYAGQQSPTNLSRRRPLGKTNISLRPNESLWFVGSVQNPYKITAFWDVKSGVGYQIYTVKRGG